MNIVFCDETRVAISMLHNPFTDIILKIYKHLQHVNIDFRPWDSYIYLLQLTNEQIIDQLVCFGNAVGVTVDKHRCLQHDQNYFNELHSIYESNYDGKSQWLDFHEHIHLSETFRQTKHTNLCIDYREKSGPIERKFDRSWLEWSTTKLEPGDVYVAWAELGKTPFNYWRDKEPNDLERIKQLAKPWLVLRPKLVIAMDAADTLENKKNIGFEQWWNQFQDPWCAHWGITTWTLEDMFSNLVVGRITDLDTVERLIDKKIYPKQVALDEFDTRT